MTPSILPTLLNSAEGRMLLAGLALAGLLLLGFGIGWTLFPDSILQYAAMTGLNLLIGPGAGMTFGYASGMTHLQVVPLNMLVETLHVLVFYPLFALSWQHLFELPARQPPRRRRLRPWQRQQPPQPAQPLRRRSPAPAPHRHPALRPAHPARGPDLRNALRHRPPHRTAARRPRMAGRQ